MYWVDLKQLGNPDNITDKIDEGTNKTHNYVKNIE